MRKLLYEQVKGFFDYSGCKWDKSGFEKAITNAFRDLTQRTMKKEDPTETISLSYFTDNAKHFLDMLQNYFVSKAPASLSDFCDFHSKACAEILEILGRKYKSVQYGKAQKIVNMTFKHLYCLYFHTKRDRENPYANHFKFCHMPLDYFTLTWFKRAILPYESLFQYQIDSWSNIRQKHYKKNGQRKDNLGYCDYVGYIYTHFSKLNYTDEYYGLTPLQAEFYIWPKIQWCLAAEALYAQGMPNGPKPTSVEKNNFEKADLENKRLLLLELLNGQF